MMNTIQKLFVFALSIPLFSSLRAVAEEAHHAGSEAHVSEHGVVIPGMSIFVQTFNVVVLFAILFYFMRKGAVTHFANRAKEYADLVQRAEAAKQQAERGHRDIKDRLDKLESGAESSLVQARKEAEDLKVKMIAEAKNVGERVKIEAERTVANEVEKAKAELRADLLQSALATSQEVLKSSLSSSEQAKLQNEFVQKIQVVGG